MADPKAYRRDIDEAQEALRSLVVTGGNAAGVLQLAETALHDVAETLKGDCLAAREAPYRRQLEAMLNSAS